MLVEFNKRNVKPCRWNVKQPMQTNDQRRCMTIDNHECKKITLCMIEDDSIIAFTDTLRIKSIKRIIEHNNHNNDTDTTRYQLKDTV